MKPSKKMLAVFVCGIAVILGVAIFGIGDGIKGAGKIRFGIDIRGGVEAIFEPQGLDREPTKGELDTARNVIETRLDGQKITDREVTTDEKGNYIIVRFPWKSEETSFNPEDAIAELGEMAQLTFRDPEGNVLLEGKNVKSASAVQNDSEMKKTYEVELIFDKEGGKLFEKATGQLIGKEMGIYMDETEISSPTVQTKITGEQAVIDNIATFEEAQNLAEKINAGALPFSLSTTNFSTISPTMGNNALHIMVIAGLIAFFMICVFMITYYKLPGIVACLTLVLQMSLQLLAISVPQYTLTLPGIAGIILSLGMAVDANIIISERISEELKKGRTVGDAIIKGYKSAFSSVLDGNITTAIVAVILMIFGSGAMLSFGYTLLVGMIVNVLVGVSVSKFLLLSFTKFDKCNRISSFREKKEIRIRNFYGNKKVVLLISGVVFLVGIGACIFKGVTLDTQFTGGAVVSYSVKGDVNTDKLDVAVEKVMNRPVTVQVTKKAVDNSQNLVVTLAGTESISPEKQKQITEAVNEITKKKASLTETYAVQPYIGEKALKNSGIAILLSVIFIIIYVWIRFATLHGLAAGLTAIAALIHDVIIVFFTFAIFGIPLNDAFVAVVLTIIGYSINDTIVLYDRIRENRNIESRISAPELVNKSISQTLARSINTSLTTGLCVLVILFASIFFQINSIMEFSLPMFFGLISGCYSSVCIASILWAMNETEKGNK